MYRYILFDLDGTLTDSSEGHYACMDYALEKLGRPKATRQIARKAIGPSLIESFTVLCGLPDQEAERAAALYMTYYHIVGNRMVRNIPGLPQTLRHLREAGLELAVASNKETEACRQVLQNLGLASYFTHVVGTTHAREENPKAAVIGMAMERFGISPAQREQVLMVGDRRYDAEGAASCGIACLGVNFCGFAPEGEMIAAGAAAVVHTAEALADYILPAKERREHHAL